MALKLRLQQVVREPDGVYSVYAEAVEDTTGKVIKKKCVQGKNKQEIKDALRPYWQSLKQSYANQQTIFSIAQEALTELEGEP